MKPVGVSAKRQPVSRDQTGIDDADNGYRAHRPRRISAIALRELVEPMVEPARETLRRATPVRRLGPCLGLGPEHDRGKRRRERQRDEREKAVALIIVTANCR